MAKAPKKPRAPTPISATNTAGAQKRTKRQRTQELVHAVSTAKLSDKELTDLMLHCASIIQFRRLANFSCDNLDPSTDCYTSSGTSPNSTVSIQRNGAATGCTMTREAAGNAGLKPCGYE